MTARAGPQSVALVSLAAAWLLGTVAAAIAGNDWWPLPIAIGAAGIAAALRQRRPAFAVIGVLAATCFVGGAWRYIDQKPPDEPGGVAVYNNGMPLRIRALVVDEPDVRGRSQRVRMSARDVFENGRWRETSGGVLLRTRLYPRYRYGDVLELSGVLETPPSFPAFDYREYLARRGVVSVMAFPTTRKIASGQGNPALAALHDTQRTLGDALTRTLPEPQAALAQGIALGQRSAIPPELTDAMNATGVSHLVAISGYNVSLVAALVISSLAWLIGRRPAALVALVTIAGYTALTGASPPVVRAAIMGSLLVVATLAGRPTSALTSIALAGAVMTGIDPQVVHDASFQLSFAAIIGIVYLSPDVSKLFADLARGWGIDAEASGVAAFVLESTAVTAGAVLATLPLIALDFGRISTVALISNLLLVPVFPLILGSSALTAIAATVWAPLGQATAWFSWAMLTYMIEVSRFFAATPLASLKIGGFGAWHAVAAYLALAAFAWWLTRRRASKAFDIEPAARGPVLQPAWLLCGGLVIAATLLWWTAFDTGGGRLVVSVLDVGQGDAILIETPEGHHVLVDGGADGQVLAADLSEELPSWDRTLDLVALTHPQEDHMAGLVEALERYDVHEVLASPIGAYSPTYVAWRDEIARQNIPYHVGQPGEVIDLGDGATLRVLGPGPEALATGEPNNASLVIKVSWRDVSFLLTGDMEAAAEEAVLRDGQDVRAQVLKVAHHGSLTSTSPLFLRAVRPSVAVVSVGANNPYGHPAPEVIDRLDNSATVLRTDQRGTVRLGTDGHRLWVDTER